MCVTRSTAQGSNGQIASLRMPNGLGLHYAYDRARRLTRVQVGTLSQDAQRRSRRTPVMVYAGGSCDIFETLSFVRLLWQLPAVAQERLRHGLDEHPLTVQQRE